MLNAAIDTTRMTALEEQARADLPYSARMFQRWLRARLVEHWQGEHYWPELDRNDFAILRRALHPNGLLVADVVALLMSGAENLTVITWAVETGQPLDDVVEILTQLDVNTRRIPRFSWLLTPLPMTRAS